MQSSHRVSEMSLSAFGIFCYNLRASLYDGSTWTAEFKLTRPWDVSQDDAKEAIRQNIMARFYGYNIRFYRRHGQEKSQGTVSFTSNWL